MVLNSNLVAVTYVLDNALVPIKEFLDVQATSDSFSTGIWNDKNTLSRKTLVSSFIELVYWQIDWQKHC